MNRPRDTFLVDQIGVLIEHFGLHRVRAAVAAFSVESGSESQRPRLKVARGAPKPSRPTVAEALESLREAEPVKYDLLSGFLVRLREGRVLPESQDIRIFAQLIGLKEIHGKSRRDMIPALMHFLLQRPVEAIRAEIARADDISQQQRREGFSVLTDKILGRK